MKKYLWSLILPITFQKFMLALVSASDALMLGAMSQDALAAVSLAGQIAFVFNLFMAALTIGISMFASQYWGIHDKGHIEELMGFVMRITVCISFIFFAAAAAVPEWLMRILTNEPSLILPGAQYLRSVGLSYLLSGASQVYLSIMRSTDRAGLSMTISTATVLLNIALNAILIYGLFGLPAMEVTGAALATVIANAAGLLWAAAHFLRPGTIRLRAHYLSFRVGELERRFWVYVTPVILNELVWGCGFAMCSVIMGHLGSDAAAANAIANIAKNLIVCFCLGLANGGSIIVGNALGAGRLAEARAAGSKLCRMSIISGIGTGLLLLLLSPLIFQVTSLSSAASVYLRGMLFICAFNLVGRSVNSMNISGIFCAGGDSKFGLRCDGITMWAVVVPLGFISAFVLKLPVLAVYFFLSLDELVKLPAVYIHYKKYLWLKNLTHEEAVSQL